MLTGTERMKTVHHRIIFCMSLLDIIQSTACGFSTFLAPKDSPTMYAYGSVVTCDMQGFMTQLGQSVMFYNCALTLSFLLQIRYKVQERTIRHKIEPLIHLISLGWPFATAIAGLKMELYNFGGNRCWINPYPFGCFESVEIMCTRGQDAFKWRWIFIGGWIIFWMIWLPASTLSIYCTVRKLEFRIKSRQIESRTQQLPSSRRRRVSISKSTRNLGIQCMLYSGIVYFTLTWPFALRIVEQTTNTQPFWLVIVNQILYPLQGLFNFVIYMRPRVMKVREENPEMSCFWAICEVLYK